jgi:hypothetical protein
MSINQVTGECHVAQAWESALAPNQTSILWMRQKSSVASSAGSSQILQSGSLQVAPTLSGRHLYELESISVETKVNQQREEKRNCEIQVSKKEFTGYQP